VSAPAVGTVAYWDWLNTRRWGRYITAEEKAAIDRAAESVPSPRCALDVGAGSGRFTRHLLDRGWSVTSVDVHPDAVDRCRARNPEAEVLQVDEDTDRLPAPAGSVSLVICIEVRAVVHSDWFLPEVRRVLVPGGRLVTVTWNRTSARGMFATAMSRRRDGIPHPHYQVPYRKWRRRLVSAGLQVEAEQGLCWFPFSRASDSRLVPVGAAVERRLGLSGLPSLSPWVLVTAGAPLTQSAG
jgi:SAM-dependent methyltransferase